MYRIITGKSKHTSSPAGFPSGSDDGSDNNPSWWEWFIFILVVFYYALLKFF